MIASHRPLLSVAVSLALLALAGCGAEQELYTRLSERQANEMVAALRSAGIEGEKISREGTFAVTTSRGDFPAAVRTLQRHGLPREEFDTIGKIFKKDGFVSSPLEERARLMHALSQEIANTIGAIDGVVTARVHIAMPERNPLGDKVKPSGASVFIKHRSDKDLTAQVAQIKALVVNSIEGLPYDNVTVALFPADAPIGEPPKAAAATPVAAGPSRLASLDLPLVGGAAAGALALGGGGLMWWRRRRPDADGGSR